MEIMTIPATPWASLPSYALSFAGPVDATVAHMGGGASRVFAAEGDAATALVGAGLVRRTVLEFHNKDFRNKDISTKDIRPGSRAWSPPV